MRANLSKKCERTNLPSFLKGPDTLLFKLTGEDPSPVVCVHVSFLYFFFYLFSCWFFGLTTILVPKILPWFQVGSKVKLGAIRSSNLFLTLTEADVAYVISPFLCLFL